MSDLAMLTGTIDPQSGMVIQPDRRMARFETVQTQNAVKSREAGRPVFEARTVLFVRHPGERDETTVLANERHQYEFPRQWAAFEAGKRADPDGTPLAILFPGDPHIVTSLRALHIFTVEMLAECGEEGLRRIGMGAREYQQRAQRFMEAAAKTAPLHQMDAKLRERDDEIALLKEQVAMLAAATKRGRPRNATPTEGDEE
jgi:hypothetical protein